MPGLYRDDPTRQAGRTRSEFRSTLRLPNKKRPSPAKGDGRFETDTRDYFELEVKLAWLAPFLILLCLIQLIVERSFAPTFSI